MEVGRASALRETLSVLAASPPPDPLELARLVSAKLSDKYDAFLDEELLCAAYASERIDSQSLPALAACVLGKWHPSPTN